MSVEVPPSLWPVVHRLAADEAWPPSTDATADRFVAQCSLEGLLPLLFAIRADEDPAPALPSTVVGALERSRLLKRVLTRRSEILQDTLAAVCRLLEEEPFLLLKGADYGHRLYPHPQLRPMQDIDLLVPRERLSAICGRLLVAGLEPYHPGGAASFAPSHPERVFRFGDVVVEIHHSFLQRSRHRVDYDGVWMRRTALETTHFRAARLGDVDALLHHALALGKDEFSVPLIRYLDFWLMLTHGDLLIEASQRAHEWQAVRALYASLRQSLRLLPELATPERERLRDSLLPAAARSFLDHRVLPELTDRGKARPGWRRRQVWRKFWLMDNPRRRVQFAFEHAWAMFEGYRVRRGSGAAVGSHTHAPAGQPDNTGPPPTVTARVLRAVLLGVAAAYVVTALAVMALRMGYPFELEWIEGASLQQVQRVREGLPLYVRPSLEFAPLIYTPLYTWVSAAAASLFGSGFLPLRLVSALASIGAGVLISRLVHRETRSGLPAFLAAALFAAMFRASGAWMDVARVDALFVFLLLLTTVLLRPHPEGGLGHPLLAGAVLGLAVLTKQTGLVAAAVFGLYALSSWPRRRAGAFVGVFLVVTGVAGLGIDHSSGGWFRYYVLGLAGHHRLAPVMLVLFWTQKVLAPLAVACLAATLYFVHRSRDPGALSRAHQAWMAAALIAVSLATHLTIGSYDNNLLPAYAALAILFGLGVDTALAVVPPLWVSLVSVACLIQFGGLFYNPARQIPTREDRAAGERIVKLLAETPGPVLAPRHPYLLAMAGKATHAHEMTLSDVLLDADGPVKAQLLAEVRDAIRSRRYAAILIDDPFLLKEEVERSYREGARLFRDERGGFWPVTGSRTRPTVLLVPR